ncbi:MAG TPA: TolC family protein [Vicinamibacterales bacterium]
MRARVARAVLAAAFLPVGAGAQTLSLTESQALAQLAPESPRVQAARAGIEIARADVLAAGRWPNPRVTFNREAVAGIAENMVTVTQPLPVTGRRRLEMSAASARVGATASRAEDRVRRLRADLRLAFTDLWTAQARERELGRSRDRLRELATVLARREDAGEAAGFDHLRAEREVYEVEADFSAAATDRARAQAALSGFFAASADAGAIEAIQADTARLPLPELDALVARAEGARGDLAAWQHELDAATFAQRAAGRRLVPEPEVVAGTKSSNAGSGDVGTMFSVHVNVPLFDRGQPESAIAQARALQAKVEAEAFRRTVRAEIAAWRAAVIERRAIADHYRAAVAAGVDQIERIALVSYEAGERGILELLDAHRTAASARVRRVQLEAAVREAEIELEFVSGWELP